jgi:hypothetical protein
VLGILIWVSSSGWCKSEADFSFMKAADFLYTHFSDGISNYFMSLFLLYHLLSLFFLLLLRVITV